MHPRTHYLADADKDRNPALQQPLLQDSSSKTEQEAAAEPPVSDEKGSGSAAASAPPLSTATGLAPASADQAPTSAYGLPSGYLAHYAGNSVKQQAYTILSGSVQRMPFQQQLLSILVAAEAPPELQSLRSPTQVVPPANQPMQQSYRMQTLGSFDDEPAIITCTQCRATGQTFTYKVTTV